MSTRTYNPEALNNAVQWCSTLEEKEEKLVHTDLSFYSYVDLHSTILSLIQVQEYLAITYEMGGTNRHKDQIVETMGQMSGMTTKLFASLVNEYEFLDKLLVETK